MCSVNRLAVWGLMVLVILRGIIELLNRPRTNRHSVCHPAERQGDWAPHTTHSHTLSQYIRVKLAKLIFLKRSLLNTQVSPRYYSYHFYLSHFSLHARPFFFFFFFGSSLFFFFCKRSVMSVTVCVFIKVGYQCCVLRKIHTMVNVFKSKGFKWVKWMPEWF